MRRKGRRVYVCAARAFRNAKNTVFYRVPMLFVSRPNLMIFVMWLRVVGMLAGSRLDALSLAMCIYAPAAWRDYCLSVRDARLSSFSR